MMRRNAQDAGRSWRKWGDPVHVDSPPAPVTPGPVIWQSRARWLLFYIVCIDVGAFAGLLVRL